MQVQVSTSIYSVKTAGFKAAGNAIQWSKQGATAVTVVSSTDERFAMQMKRLVESRDAQQLSAPIFRTLENMPASITTSADGVVRKLTLTIGFRGAQASLAIEGVEPVAGAEEIHFSTRAMVPFGKPSAVMVKRGDSTFVYVVTVTTVKN